MLNFDIVTLFPEVFDEYLETSILARAQKKRLVKFVVHDLRKWTKDKHRTVDDRPYGGGPGMVLKVEPVFKAVAALKKKQETRNKKQTRVILFSASGKQFTQRKAAQYAKKYNRIIFICGRYEGVDARVGKYIADEELSIGPYVLTGGELPAMVVVDAVTRLVPGVIRPESLAEESFGFQKEARLRGAVARFGRAKARLRSRASAGAQFGSSAGGGGRIGEYPQFTRPEAFYPNLRKVKTGWRVPKVLLSGDHKKIAEWRQKHLHSHPLQI